MNNNNH